MRVFVGRIFVGLVLIFLSTSIPALAAGSSLPYGKGGWFPQFDPIVRQYNQSGEQFRIEGHFGMHNISRDQECLHCAQSSAAVSRRP